MACNENIEINVHKVHEFLTNPWQKSHDILETSNRFNQRRTEWADYPTAQQAYTRPRDESDAKYIGCDVSLADATDEIAIKFTCTRCNRPNRKGATTCANYECQGNVEYVWYNNEINEIRENSFIRISRHPGTIESVTSSSSWGYPKPDNDTIGEIGNNLEMFRTLFLAYKLLQDLNKKRLARELHEDDLAGSLALNTIPRLRWIPNRFNELFWKISRVQFDHGFRDLPTLGEKWEFNTSGTNAMSLPSPLVGAASQISSFPKSVHIVAAKSVPSHYNDGTWLLWISTRLTLQKHSRVDFSHGKTVHADLFLSKDDGQLHLLKFLAIRQAHHA